MKTLKANWIPLAAFCVVAALLWQGVVTVEQALVLFGAVAIPGVRRSGAALALALWLVACHPEQSCYPQAAAAREAKCIRAAIDECLHGGRNTDSCYAEVQTRCDLQARMHEDRCTK